MFSPKQVDNLSLKHFKNYSVIRKIKENRINPMCMVKSDSSYSWRSLYHACISHVSSGDCVISQHNDFKTCECNAEELSPWKPTQPSPCLSSQPIELKFQLPSLNIHVSCCLQQDWTSLVGPRGTSPPIPYRGYVQINERNQKSEQKRSH